MTGRARRDVEHRLDAAEAATGDAVARARTTGAEALEAGERPDTRRLVNDALEEAWQELNKDGVLDAH